MTEPPRGGRGPSQIAASRLPTVVTRMNPSALGGRSRSIRAVTTRVVVAGLSRAGLFDIVIHGDDGTIDRPDVLWALWVGAATPANGIDYDIWYTATI